ncbi:MAG: hypothetical protein SW833_20075 [Cyanobacteriota bacterium]|nr:hypothetical protein [Cyanobacteriota bacterium]
MSQELQRLLDDALVGNVTDVLARLNTRQIQELEEAVRLEAAGDEGAEALLEVLQAELGDDFEPAYNALQRVSALGSRNRLFQTPTTAGTPNLPAGTGRTDAFGNIT